MSKVDSAVSCFEEGFSCSQAILSTYGTQFGLNREIALRMASPFGGGMARMGETCGAVTGAVMVIGLKYGTADSEDMEKRERIYELVREFVDKFKSRNRSIKCRELLDCDISTPEGRKQAKDNELFDTLCPKLVRDAAEIIEQIL